MVLNDILNRKTNWIDHILSERSRKKRNTVPWETEEDIGNYRRKQKNEESGNDSVSYKQKEEIIYVILHNYEYIDLLIKITLNSNNFNCLAV